MLTRCRLGGGVGGGAVQPSLLPKLQAQVYDIVPPDTAMADYAIGLPKLPANEDFRCCSNGSKSVTDNSVYIRPFLL